MNIYFDKNTATNIRIYASLAEVLKVSIGAFFSGSCGQKELY
jgi:hypothetical protein